MCMLLQLIVLYDKYIVPKKGQVIIRPRGMVWIHIPSNMIQVVGLIRQFIVQKTILDLVCIDNKFID